MLKVLLIEEESEIADEIWAKSRQRFASDLIYPEARAALASAYRSKRLRRAELRRAVKNLDAACSSMTLIGVDSELSRSAGEVAEQYALRGYDAVHLATAMSIHRGDLIFATWDKDLSAAAKQSGHLVTPPR